MPDNNKIILGTNDDTYIAADDAGNIILQHEGGNRVSMSNTSITPASNEQIDLGSSTNKFRDLYISSNSLFVGNTKISADPTTGELTSAVANNQGVFGAPAAIGGADTSNLNNPQETLLAVWKGGTALGGDNPTTFQFENNAGTNIPSPIIGHATGTINGPGGIAINHPLLQTRVRYGSSYTNVPLGNATLKLKNKGNIPSGQFMYDDGNTPSTPGYSINPNFDHLKLVYYEEGMEGGFPFSGTPTYNYYWRVLDANGNDVNFWDGVDFFAYSPLANLQFGHNSDPGGWGFLDVVVRNATDPTWELYESTNQVEIEGSIKIKGEPYSSQGVLIKDNAGSYRRITVDTVGNVSSVLV